MSDIKNNYGISANTVKADALAVGEGAHAESHQAGFAMEEVQTVLATLQQQLSGQSSVVDAKIEALTEQVASGELDEPAARGGLEALAETIKQAGIVVEAGAATAGVLWRMFGI